MNIAKYVPNTITCFNLVSGCAASVAALEGNLLLAALTSNSEGLLLVKK